jgi:4'-phosphopantetheinyl transferase
MIERHAPGPRDAPVPLTEPSRDEVHVWTIRLDLADWRDSLPPEELSDDELVRAGRFLFERERRRFAICRATLRAILGGYLGTRPGELSFRTGPYGKPHLDPERYGERIRFNVSHSGELALVAVSRERELGVDIEHVRPLDGIDEIVARHFSPGERLALKCVAPTARLAMFYQYWTLKEAYLKACGVGLSRALEEVDVSGACDHPIRLPDVSAVADEKFWTGRTLDPPPGYVAALVVEGRGGSSARTIDRMPSELMRRRSRHAPSPLTLADTPHTVVATAFPHG